MGTDESTKSGADALSDTAADFLSQVASAATLPLAMAVASFGQFALASIVALVTPAAGDSGVVAAGADGFIYLQFSLLIVQGALLVYAVIRAGMKPLQVYLALAALVWAFGSLLVMVLVLQCDLYGLCL